MVEARSTSVYGISSMDDERSNDALDVTNNIRKIWIRARIKYIPADNKKMSHLGES